MVHDDSEFLFCSSGCMTRFQKHPARSLDGTPENAVPDAHPAVAGAIHTCPMHPDVCQEGPGSCPKCGMSLDPEVVALPASGTKYVCPMHPEIVRDEPGSCPICGTGL